MIITYHGDNSFKVQSGKLSLITDPQPRFKGDITLLTQLPDLTQEWPPANNYVYGPGEYEKGGIEIKGVPSKNQSTMYIAKMDDMRLCFLGNTTEIDPALLDKFGQIDILFASSELGLKAIKQIDPKIIIPSGKKPDSLKLLLKELDQKANPQEKLTIKAKDLPTKLTVVALKT